MTKRGKKTVRYSDCFKLQVVSNIEKEGLSIEACRRKYGISGGSTIQSWLRKYGKRDLYSNRIHLREINKNQIFAS
jgi:transposase-like protein